MDASHSTVPFTVKLDPIPVLAHGESHQAGGMESKGWQGIFA